MYADDASDALAELVDPTGTGTLPEQRSGAALWAPSDAVVLDGDALAWHIGLAAGHLVRPEWPVERFAKLWQADEAVILDYAQQTGLLGLCSCGWPLGHPATVPGTLWPSAGLNRGTVCTARSFLAQREPLATWRYWSRVAAAILSLAVALRGGRGGSSADWQALATTVPWASDSDRVGIDRLAAELALGGPESVGEGRYALADVVSTLLRLADAHLAISWDIRGSRIDMRVQHGLGAAFGRLVLDLALAVAGVEGWAVCQCGAPFRPARRSHAGEQRFCESCRSHGVPRRRAQDRYYERRVTDPAFREAERERLRAYRARATGPTATPARATRL
ncbi:MAG: hypothetical protein ACYDB6_02970 [Candidatus Limnocylindrales bacterium]